MPTKDALSISSPSESKSSSRQAADEVGRWIHTRFTNLRNTICAAATELSRFRELATNAVMATDIVDKELKQLRNNRWDKAFKWDNNAIILQAYEEEDETRDSINWRLQLWLSTWSKHRTLVIPCSIGSKYLYVAYHSWSQCCSVSNGWNLHFRFPVAVYTESGMKTCSERATRHTLPAELLRIQVSIGTRARSGSLTFTSFHWRRNWKVVVSLANRAMSFW